jgi:hypothetical protein
MNSVKTGLKGLVILACFTLAQSFLQALAHPAGIGHTTFSIPAVTPKLGSISINGNSPPLSISGTTPTFTPTTKTLVAPGPVSTTTLPGTQSDSQTTITAVLNGDWASWTGSSTGTLSVAQLAGLLSNTSITGSQAAVLGMIGSQMNNYILNSSGNAPPYTLAQVQSALSTNGQSNTFMNDMADIAAATNANGTFNLYGAYKTANYSITQQGSVMGNCYFLSSINALLNQNPNSLTGMIRPKANDLFKVIFPLASQFGLPTQEMVTLTAGDIALLNQSGANGGYLTILALAENQLLIQYSNADLSGYKLTSTVAAMPLAPLGDGGYGTQMLSLLTGKTYANINYNHPKWTTTFVDALLQKDFSGASAVPIDIESNDHVLTIIGYNPTTQNVIIHNPWGTNGLYGYNEDSGIRNQDMEVEMQNGVFTLSTANMLTDFSTLCVQKSLIQNITPTTDPFIKGMSSAPGTALFSQNTASAMTSSMAAITSTPLSATSTATMQAANAAMLQSPALNLASTLAQIQPATMPSNFGNISTTSNGQNASFNAPSAEVGLDDVTQISTGKASLCSSVTSVGTNLVDTGDYVEDAADGEQTAMK